VRLKHNRRAPKCPLCMGLTRRQELGCRAVHRVMRQVAATGEVRVEGNVADHGQRRRGLGVAVIVALVLIGSGAAAVIAPVRS
jgi:hypothetical protein